MKNLQFKQLLLLSDTQKKANQFLFQKRFNLITADDNSVGKSTLAKLLLWTFGCEPDFDSTWKSTDCKCLVDFSIDGTNYKILRYQNFISLKEENQEILKYTNIGGDYSKKFAELVDFKVLLPKRGSDETELVAPPPAYYFLPFYMDQKNSWSKTWNSFGKLGQFDSWQKTVIKYHLGYLSPKHFELEQDLSDNKRQINELNQEVEKIGYALDVVKNHIPNNEITINEEQFQIMTKEIQEELAELSKLQEQFLNELSNLTSDKVYLEHQKTIAEHLIKELESDYVFSVENIEDDDIECPLCGTIHENSIVNRSSILVDKQQAVNQLDSINAQLQNLIKKAEKTQKEYEQIKEKINHINVKYKLKDNSQSIPLNDIIEKFAYKSINDNITNTKKEKLLKIDDYKNGQKEIKKEQNALLTKEERQKLDNAFLELLHTYIKLLNAEGINLSSIKTPLDYNKIVKEGGAAEGTRGVLSYYLAIFSMINIYGSEINAPLVIDTPNQQEQSDKNYENIVNLITQKIPDTEQIIICAMENDKLKEYKKDANVIKLNKDKLLQASKYDEVKQIFDEMEK